MIDRHTSRGTRVDLRWRSSVCAAVATAALVAESACVSGGVARARPASSEPASDAPNVSDAGGRTLENLFAGRFAGVTVTSASNGRLQIRIRGGSNSFLLSNEPLYVVDETPISPGAGGIGFLSPYDIERIEVLKNPADVAIYGMRGANGVVRITTTRSGRQKHVRHAEPD
jgi:TonB-dependent SusC/RagA subfamily outer membrane receptor